MYHPTVIDLGESLLVICVGSDSMIWAPPNHLATEAKQEGQKVSYKVFMQYMEETY